MKLLYCLSCGDIFNLALRRVKRCSCGAVAGQYVNNQDAEVNGEGVSLAMGTGSIAQAVFATLRGEFKEFRADGDPWKRHATSIICWARPHEGEGNSHTSVVRDLK